MMEKIGFDESVEIITERIKKRETEKLKKRDLERQLELEKKREERAENAASNEKVEFFIESFKEKQQQIKEALDLTASGAIEKSELPHRFDNIVKNIQSLQSYVAQSTYFLRVYDIRKSQEVLQDLQQGVQELEERLLPKKKFSFKGRKPVVKAKKETFGCKIEDCVDSSSVPETHLTKPMSSEDNICGFTQRVGETLTLKHELILKKDVILSNLENCTVRLLGVSSTLHATKLCNSRVICGPVVTSVFIDDCTDCTFVLACQQLRVHNVQCCDFYLHVTSRSIIEDTKAVRFAPYKWKFDDTDKHFQLAGLDVNRNNWDLIDDFNWLACDKPSPNWRVLKDNERSLDWI